MKVKNNFGFWMPPSEDMQDLLMQLEVMADAGWRCTGVPDQPNAIEG
jgi:hypothetical protein